jgi:hypothetical protein
VSDTSRSHGGKPPHIQAPSGLTRIPAMCTARVHSSATLGSSATHNEGAASLGISNVAYVELRSSALASVALNDGNMSLDVLLPTVQPNPYWYGQLQLYVDCPSANMHNRYVASQELTGLLSGHSHAWK